MKMVWQNRDILKQSFFEVHGEKKNTVQKRKKKTCQKIPKTVPRRSAKKNSELSETKFQK